MKRGISILQRGRGASASLHAGVTLGGILHLIGRIFVAVHRVLLTGLVHVVNGILERLIVLCFSLLGSLKMAYLLDTVVYAVHRNTFDKSKTNRLGIIQFWT